MSDQFEIYKLLVEEVRETRSARRELANVFTTLNLGGVGALAFLADPKNSTFQPLLIWVAFALILTCWIWRTSNRYYTLLLKAKYDVLYELEPSVTTDTPLKREYELMRPKRAMRLFSLERFMPYVFIAGYLVFLAYTNLAIVRGLIENAITYLPR